MGATEIFGGGVFVALWVVAFFGFSAYQVRKTYEVKTPPMGEVAHWTGKAPALRALPKPANP